MESTMVMSRNQIQEVKEKAQQKREEREARALNKGKKRSQKKGRISNKSDLR